MMKVLKGILGESKKYYLDTKKKIIAKIANLPKGSVKERVFNGRKYYYLQERKGEKVVQKYLGKSKPEDLIKKIEEYIQRTLASASVFDDDNERKANKFFVFFEDTKVK